MNKEKNNLKESWRKADLSNKGMFILSLALSTAITIGALALFISVCKGAV